MFRWNKVVTEGGIKRQIHEVLTLSEFTLFFLLGHKCAEGDMKCADGIECISIHSMCNYYRDCNDGSDELEETCRGEILQPHGVIFNIISDIQCHCGYMMFWLVWVLDVLSYTHFTTI